MRVASKLHDGRIKSTNYLMEMTIVEYLNLVGDVLAKNEFQRRRVSSSKTIYSLLKTDIRQGCVIPPIVLALTSAVSEQALSQAHPAAFLTEHRGELVILDGLQRTYSLMDLKNELMSLGDEEGLRQLSTQQLRIEIYVGINRLGILYRMLTLNTGQTPMSLRQQIEMLYLDYAKVPVDGITLIREVEEKTANGPSEYNFREVIEGFNSYLERNELPIERTDLLENIKSLEKLSQENENKDLFKEYLLAWHAFVASISNATAGAVLDDDPNDASPPPIPLGKSAVQCFKKAQAITGFGAAVGRLIDFKLIDGFEAITDDCATLEAPEDPVAFLLNLNKRIYWINNNSKKIGNAQRMYFQYYFRELFNPESDQFKKPGPAVDAAFLKYQSQN